MRLTAVDGRTWEVAAVRDAIVSAEKSPAPLALVAVSGDVVRELHVTYHGGLRHPHLIRSPQKPDVLSQILAPRSGAADRKERSR
jgi:hypothetical protein